MLLWVKLKHKDIMKSFPCILTAHIPYRSVTMFGRHPPAPEKGKNRNYIAELEHTLVKMIAVQFILKK